CLPPLGLLGGLAPRGQPRNLSGPAYCRRVGDEPISGAPVPLLFGMRSLGGTMTGSSIDAEDTLSSSSLQPMIETVPLAPNAFGAAEAYGRMMRNEARMRIVLVTGQLQQEGKEHKRVRAESSADGEATPARREPHRPNDSIWRATPLRQMEDL